jgi:hypothetical protein
MLLGEALADRSSKKKQLEQVEARAASVARYQEGEEPAENADELLEKAGGSSPSCGNWPAGSIGPTARPSWTRVSRSPTRWPSATGTRPSTGW